MTEAARRRDVDDEIAAIAAEQGGVISRRDLEALAVRRTYVRRRLRAKQWQRVLPATYATFTGPLPPHTRVWAAIVYAGNGAVASHRTAAWLDGLVDALPETIDVCVPHGRRHRPSRRGVRIRQSRQAVTRRNPTLSPPRTRIEDSVLDLCDEATEPGPVIDLILRATQRRKTTTARLAEAAARRKRLRWRELTRDLLGEAQAGVQSPLELRYRRDVEAAHGLPRGERNAAETSNGVRRYRDVRYREFQTLVELDGQVAHPTERREFDDMRDNEVLLSEDARTLRYGWRSVAGGACAVAGQVGRLLASGGWGGQLRPCGPQCTALRQSTDRI